MWHSVELCKKLILVFASCVMAASCGNTYSDLPFVESDKVSFTASMKAVSRATETDFEETDEIAVYAVKEDENGKTELKSSGNYADNIRYTYTGGKFISEKGIVRPAEFGVRYFAIYPYSSVTGVPTFKFSVKTDQGMSGHYTLSDLCTAVSDVTSAKDVDLVFSHRLSHVIVNLEGESLGTEHVTVRLTDVNVGCDVNLNNNTFIEYDSKETVCLTDNGTNSYKAIIVPQTIEKGSPFLTVTLNGKEYMLKADADLRFASGKQQTFNLVIENGEIVTYTSSILPWGESEDTNQEKAVNVYIAGMFDGLHAGYVPCMWSDTKMHTLGINGYDEGEVYGCVYSMAASGNDLYVAGHQVPPPGSEPEHYRENATIWKNGAILYDGSDFDLATTCDILVFNNDLYAVGLGNNSAPYIRKNNEISWLPKRLENKNNWAQSVAESNGNIYVMGRNVTAHNNYFGTNQTFFWKNQKLMDYVIDGDGLCMSVQDDNIYCLVEKTDGLLYLWKNGSMTATGLSYSHHGIVGPNFKQLFIDGEDVYIIGHQDDIAKIWKNGEVSMLTDENNDISMSGIYVHNKDVYVIGYKIMYSARPQYSIVKLWKNGEEITLDNGGWITYACGIVVTDNENY